MLVELRITKGARSGTRERFDKPVVAIGRHPINDLRFDAERDLDVSSRHAELRSVGGRYVLVDLDSTNGTFVNGTRIGKEHEIKPGDLLTFGANGPQVEFHVVAASGAAATRVSTAGGGTGRAPTEVRIAMAVQQETGALKRMIGALAVVVIVGALAAVWMTRSNAAETRAQMAALLASNDSLSHALTRNLEQTGIADASLAAARAEAERLESELRAQQQRGGDVSSLAERMRDAQSRTASIAGMDHAAVAAENQAAVVFLIVEFADSVRSSGTGFNVDPSGLIVTNRHVVQRADGDRAQRIAVAFDGTSGAWKRARIELVSETDELAFLRLSSGGPYPVVKGLASRAARTGQPVAILGYPLGTSTAGMDGDINTLRPAATLSVGTVSKVLPETVQLDAFAAQGSSGSPVFNDAGEVLGVIYGGAGESGGRIVYAVPSLRLLEQLPGRSRQ